MKYQTKTSDQMYHLFDEDECDNPRIKGTRDEIVDATMFAAILNRTPLDLAWLSLVKGPVKKYGSTVSRHR